MKKWVKILLWIAGVLLAVVLLVALLLSPIAKHYVNNHGEELVGRTVHVEGLRANLFTGHVAVHGLSLYEDNGQDLFASFDTLDVKAGLLPLLWHTVKLKHITLAGLKVNLVHQGEHFNFQSLIDHFASDEPDTDTTPSDWVLKFYNIRLSHAQLRYRDMANGSHWILPDINLRVPGFILGGEEASQGGLNIGFAEGGRLNIDAHYNAPENSYTMAAKLDGFLLKNIQPLVEDFVKFDRMEGHLSANLKASGNFNALLRSSISGTLTLRDVDLHNNGAAVASLRELGMTVNNINIEANSYDLQRVKLDGLTACYEQWSDHSTVDNLLVVSGEQGDTVEDAESTVSGNTGTFSLKIAELSVTGCNLTYDDHSLPDEFHFPITDLGIQATNLSTGGDNNARLRATLPGGGHLMVMWKGNIDNWKDYQDIFLSIKGLDMKQLSPWTVYYTGQPVEDGVFGITSRLNINHSQLDNRNKIDIYNARVGSRRKDVEPQMKIPLKTALYILRDKNNKTLIDLPVTGNIDSPEFSYMKVVWKTLGNLLVKVATSPARALGNALGIGGDDLDFIVIEPGQRSLTSENYHTLSDLATIAMSDSLITLSLEQRMPVAANDTVARWYEMRNETVRRYLMEQGVAEHQISVTTGEPVADGEKTGYAITSEMKIE